MKNPGWLLLLTALTGCGPEEKGEAVEAAAPRQELATQQQGMCGFGGACTTECIYCCWGNYNYQQSALYGCQSFCCSRLGS